MILLSLSLMAILFLFEVHQEDARDIRYSPPRGCLLNKSEPCQFFTGEKLLFPVGHL